MPDNPDDGSGDGNSDNKDDSNIQDDSDETIGGSDGEAGDEGENKEGGFGLTGDDTTEEEDTSVTGLKIEGELGDYIWGETPDTSNITVYLERANGALEEITDYSIDMNYPKRDVPEFDADEIVRGAWEYTFDYGAQFVGYEPGEYNAVISFEDYEEELPYTLKVYYAYFDAIFFWRCSDYQEHSKVYVDGGLAYYYDYRSVNCFVCWMEVETCNKFGSYITHGMEGSPEYAGTTELEVHFYIPFLYDYKLTYEDYSSFLDSIGLDIEGGNFIKEITATKGLGSESDYYKDYVYTGLSIVGHYHTFFDEDEED